MSLTGKDMQNIQNHLAPLLGQPAWNCRLGEGTFITIEFGAENKKTKSRKVHGEWHLWIYFCAWRMESRERVIVASEDTAEQMSSALQLLEGKKLISVDMTLPGFDTIFNFEDLNLRVFPVTTTEACAWMLYDPKEMVLEIGPGSNWRYISIHSSD